jgi:DNA-binding NarL/FixJ family response regulator
MRAGVPIRLLIADGQKLAVDTLIELLRQENHIDVVGVATNGAEAVELAEALLPDVVLIDPTLPVLDGYEATRQMRLRGRAPSVLVLTSGDDGVNLEEARDAGAAGFVRKDAGAVELLGLIVSMASLDA